MDALYQLYKLTVSKTTNNWKSSVLNGAFYKTGQKLYPDYNKPWDNNKSIVLSFYLKKNY